MVQLNYTTQLIARVSHKHYSHFSRNPQSKILYDQTVILCIYIPLAKVYRNRFCIVILPYVVIPLKSIRLASDALNLNHDSSCWSIDSSWLGD